MVIKRIILNQEIEIVLTDREIQQAHQECVTNFMKNTLMNDFEIDNEELAEELANEAYQEYCRGDGLTEYECIEKIYDDYYETSKDEEIELD